MTVMSLGPGPMVRSGPMQVKLDAEHRRGTTTKGSRSRGRCWIRPLMIVPRRTDADPAVVAHLSCCCSPPPPERHSIRRRCSRRGTRGVGRSPALLPRRRQCRIRRPPPRRRPDPVSPSPPISGSGISATLRGSSRAMAPRHLAIL